MGYSTRYVGSLCITPSLNPAELAWMSGFAEWHGGPDGDIYAVPMNPRAAWAAALEDAGERGVTMALPKEVPWSVFDWQPSVLGTHLRWCEREKSNDAEVAIRFLIDQFFGPSALARQSGQPVFEEFTFDHELNGVIAGERDDSGELFLLRVVDNVIEHEVIVRGTDPWAWDFSALLEGLDD